MSRVLPSPSRAVFHVGDSLPWSSGMYPPIDEDYSEESFLGMSEQWWVGTRERFQMLLDRLAQTLQQQEQRLANEIDSIVQGNCFREGTSRAACLESVFRKSRGLLYGDNYKEGTSSEEETHENSERQMESSGFFANLGSVEELKDFVFKMKRVLHFIIADAITESAGTSFGFSNLSVSGEFRLSVVEAMDSQNWEKVGSLIMPIAVVIPGRAALYQAVAIFRALLLSVVYQYLMGLVERGGAIYSSGSLEFRSIYISIVLFPGAYVWIKFRDVAPPSLQKPSPGLYRRSELNESGVKVYIGNYEPRFKPSGSKNGYISVGSYEEEQDAMSMYQILAFYYGKGEGELHLVDDDTHHIPPMTEVEQRLSGLEKRQFVKGKAKVVFNDYRRRMDSIYLGWLLDSEIQPSGDICNMVPPLPDHPGASAIVDQMDSSGAQVEGYLFLGNQSDDIGSVPPGNCSPDVGPVTQGMQHMPNDALSHHVVGMQQIDASEVPANGAAFRGKQPLEFQLQLESLQDNQASNPAILNVTPDYLGLLREMREFQRQQQVQQLRNQRQESQISEMQRQQQVQQLQSQRQESQISELRCQHQLQQLRSQQQESRLAELEGELERVASTEHVRKRRYFDLTFTHDLQN